MKNTKKLLKKGFTLVELLVVIAIIAILAGLATPAIFNALKAGELTKTTHNMKQLSVALLQYEQQFGHYPIAEDATEFPDAFTDGVNSSTGDSNGPLSLLIASSNLKSEENFFAKGGSPSGDREPDNDFSTSSSVLEDGECGMAYVLKDSTTSFSTSDNSSIPLLLSPMEDESTYNPDPYNSKGVALRIDGSAKQGTINPDGDTLLINNKDILDTNTGSPLEGEDPVVLPPA